MGVRPLTFEEVAQVLVGRVRDLQAGGADYPTALAQTAQEVGFEIETVLDLIVRFAPGDRAVAGDQQAQKYGQA
jgi:hypothetical protein